MEPLVPRRPSRTSSGEARERAPGERVTVLAAGIPPDLLVLVAFLLLGLVGQALNALRERAAERARRRASAEGRERTSAPGGARESAGQPSSEPDIEELEQSGAELWRRLLEGLAPEPGSQPEVVHVPPAAAPPAEPERPPQRAAPRPAEPTPGPSLVESLSQAPALELAEVALEPAFPASDLDHDLGGEIARGGEPLAPDESDAPSAAPVRSLARARDELWRAVVWSEILAPPLALRDPEALHAGVAPRAAASWHS